MNEKRGIEVLTRLRDLLGAGVHPTVRDTGLTEAEARWLVHHKMIALGDKNTWTTNKDATPFEARYEIAEITDTALSYLASSGISPSPVVADTQVREMFFRKNSQWDAFIAIREIIDKAKSELMLVDPYCDREFFGILQSSVARPQKIHLLCRSNATALKAEAKAFAAQHLGMNIELRTSSDFHDRFLVVDQSICFHIGASINHAGSKAFMISAVEDERNRSASIKAVNDAWNAGTPV